MKVLITGGAGFIGSQMIGEFLKSGLDVLAYDNLSLGQLEFLEPWVGNKSFSFFEGDLLNSTTLQQKMEGCELVVHLAANSDISQGPSRTDLDFRNGTQATYNVLDCMRQIGIKKLIFASTSAVYGEALIKPTPEFYGPLFPISYYGASKLACEAMCSAFAHNCGIRTWIYRFANIVGPNSTHGAILDFVRRLWKDPAVLTVLGDGTQRKSYLHVEDCISGMLFGMANGKGQKGRAEVDCFNLAADGVTSVREIAEEVVAQMESFTGVLAKIKYGQGGRGWVGDVGYTHIDSAPLVGLGWRPKHSSTEAMKRAVKQIIVQTRAERA